VEVWREGGVWLVVPPLSLDAVKSVRVRGRLVHVAESVRGHEVSDALVAAYAEAPISDVWLGVPTDERPGAEVEVVHGDDEPTGIMLTTAKRRYLRGEGRWFPLPQKDYLCEVPTYTEANLDLVRIFDAHELLGPSTHIEALETYGGLDLGPVDQSRQVPFHKGFPSALAVRGAESTVLASGPFVVSNAGACIAADDPSSTALGFDMRRRGELVTWVDVHGRLRFIDAWFGTHGDPADEQAHASIHGLGQYYSASIRALNLEDSAWVAAQARAPIPRDLGELRTLALRSRQAPFGRSLQQTTSVAISDDLILVDARGSTTWAVMVRVVPVEEWAVQEDVDLAARAAWAEVAGLQLLMPGDPLGISVDDALAETNFLLVDINTGEELDGSSLYLIQDGADVPEFGDEGDPDLRAQMALAWGHDRSIGEPLLPPGVLGFPPGS
jgi:hypothetical protein